MLAIIEGSVSVLKKKWKRLRHESRRPHFAFVPLRKARDEDNDAAFAPRQEVSRKVNDEVENPHEFTLFSFLTKSHNLILDTALCVESREQIFEGKVDDGAVVGTSASGEYVAWVSAEEERMYIGDLGRLVVTNRLPVPLRVQDEEASNLRETSYVSNVEDVYVSNDAKTVAVVYHFKEKTYVEAWNGKLWLRVITLPKGADCFVDLSRHLDIVVIQVQLRDGDVPQVALTITDNRYEVTPSAAKCRVLESVSLDCRDIGVTAGFAEKQVVAFMTNNYEQRALGVNATEDPKIMFYSRSTEHIFEYDLRSGIGIADGISIHAMAWTCDGLFLSVALSDGTLVVLTNCGEPVQLYVKGNLGAALERRRIEEFKVDCPRMYNIPKNKLVKQNMLRGQWTTVAHPGLPLFLITNGCVIMMIKLPTFSLYHVSLQGSALTYSYNAAIKALTYGVDSDDVLEEECHGLELIRKEDYVRHAFHAWTLLLNYPYQWSGIFHDTCTKLLRHLSAKALSRGRENMDVLRIASQLLFVYERDQRVGSFLVNELACFARLLVTSLAEEKRFYEAAHVLRLFEQSRKYHCNKGVEAWKQRDLNESDVDPVLSDQIRRNVAYPILAIAHDRVQEWSRRHEHAKPENAESEEGLELNADAVLNFLIYLRLPEDKVEERAVALAKAGALPYMCHLLKAYDLQTAVAAALEWASNDELGSDVEKALKLLAEVIFCYFVDSAHGVYVPHPITCYDPKSSYKKRLQLQQLREASAGVEAWTLTTAFDLGSRVLDTATLYGMLLKVGDTLLVLSLLERIVHRFEHNQAYNILRRQFCLSVLRKTALGMTSLFNLLKTTELKEDTNFSLLYFLLQYLRRNKTSLNPLSSTAAESSTGSTVLSIVLAMLRARDKYSVCREMVTSGANCNGDRWVALYQHAVSVLWALACNERGATDIHSECSRLCCAIIPWTKHKLVTPKYTALSKEVESSFSVLPSGTTRLITGVTSAILESDPKLFSSVLDLVFGPVTISEKPLAPSATVRKTPEAPARELKAVVEEKSSFTAEAQTTHREEVEVINPPLGVTHSVTQAQMNTPAKVTGITDGESPPDWHITLSDQKAAQPSQHTNHEALDLLLETQQHILDRLDQLDSRKERGEDKGLAEPSDASSYSSCRISEASQLEIDDEEEPYSAAARIFNRKVMGSLRWRKLPEQSPTRVYSEDKSEVLAAKATAIPTLELIKTQTKIRRWYCASTKERDIVKVRKPRKKCVEKEVVEEEATHNTEVATQTLATVSDEQAKENSEPNSHILISQQEASRTEKDPSVRRKDIGIVAHIEESDGARMEQGTQCEDLDVDSVNTGTLPERNKARKSTPEPNEDVKVDVPVFVRCDATPLSTAALRNFSSPAIALNLGNDHPTGLVHIAGEGRQFLHVVDLNESDLL